MLPAMLSISHVCRLFQLNEDEEEERISFLSQTDTEKILDTLLLLYASNGTEFIDYSNSKSMSPRVIVK